MVSSTLGSATSMGWKRRSSAASFSICLRYSFEGGGAHAAELAPGQGGFQHVAGVHGPFGRARAHQGVQLIDEQDELAFGVGDFLEHRLEPFFEFAAELGAGDQRPISRATRRLSLRVSGTSPLTMRWASPSTMAVLPTPASPMSTGLFLVRRESTWMMRRISLVPADDRVELAGPGHGRQVAGVLFQGLILVLGGLVGDAGGTPEFNQGLEDGFGGEADLGQEFAGVAGFVRGQGVKDVLGGDVFILHLTGLLESLVQDFI